MAGLVSIVVLMTAAMHLHSWAPLRHLPLAFALVGYGLWDEIAGALRLRRRDAPRRPAPPMPAPSGAGASAQCRAPR